MLVEQPTNSRGPKSAMLFPTRINMAVPNTKNGTGDGIGAMRRHSFQHLPLLTLFHLFPPNNASGKAISRRKEWDTKMTFHFSAIAQFESSAPLCLRIQRKRPATAKGCRPSTLKSRIVDLQAVATGRAV